MVIQVKGIPFVMGQKVTATIRGEVFTVGVRGWKTGEYVITDLPKVGGEVYRVAPQTGVQIHFTRDGLFVNFKSSASWALTQAISLLVIEYPTKPDIHNLRKSERFKTTLPLKFFTEEGEQKIEDTGVLRDISSGGALIGHKKEVPKKATFHISLELPPGNLIHAQRAEIKNIRKNPKNQSEAFVTGVKWKDVNPENLKALKEFIAARSGDRRRQNRKGIN